MLRTFNLVWLGVAVFAGASLFHTSYRVQALREELQGLDRQIGSERDGIQVLKAEWSFLNDPNRLEQLVSSHLSLRPITSAQIAGFDALPVRANVAPIPVSATPGAGIGGGAGAASPMPPGAVAAPAARPPVPAASSPVRRTAPPSGVRSGPAPSHRQGPPPIATLAAVPAPMPPPPRRMTRPTQPVTGPTYAVAHASLPAAHSYVPARDEIGGLMTRLGQMR